MTWVLITGLIMLAVALPIVGRRVLFLYRLVRSGQPAPDRVANVTGRLGAAVRNQLVEVFGQRRLLKWTIPGAAHAMVFWAFLILGTVYLEAFGILFSRNPEWAIPLVGHWDVLGFAQDTIALLCLLGLFLFWQIRLKNTPDKLGRQSRFKGSHLGGAYLVLFMIFNVIWTMFFFRGSAAALDNLPYGWGAYGSQAVGALLSGIDHDALEVMEGVGLLLHIGVMLVFLVEVVHSKHLHIFLAPVNVLFKREQDGVALGAVKPLMNNGKPVTLDDIEDLDEEASLGVGTIEDFSWKGLLDMATCTECGRCQSQCPAWNTEKPLSPKLLIMELRDHAFAKGPYVLAGEGGRDGLSDEVKAEAARPLIGDESVYGVIDPDVLWSCVTCGACVQQCPVDIEHVDHIVDMRRYQVLVESNFPAELNQLFKGMENKGNPWNMSPTARMDWAKGLDFEVKVVGEDIESLDEVEWLFWVGCAGAYEDRAKKTTRAVAELLDMAGVSFGVLGNGETCTGDQARRAGNEFVFQGLAQQNVETFKEYKVKKVVSTCAHCFNTLKNEYKEFGIELEVVHHTQLLNRLVREGKLTPVKDGAGAAKRSITYHDPCYIGRHNGVYTPPRELLQVLPGAEYVEMERNSEKSFCCGAGGARMWMEETIGERINVNRTKEAVATGADQIAVGCPFCRVMLSDGLTAEQAKGEAREEVEVLDVAQMLLASVKGESATRAAAKAGSNGAAAAKAGAPAEEDEATKAEPEAGDVTQTEDTVTETSEVGPAAKASGGGSSLFDLGDDTASTGPESKSQEQKSAEKQAASGGSLFDLGGDDDEPAAKGPADADPEKVAKAEKAAPSGAPATTPAGEDLGSGGSLFDLGGDSSDSDSSDSDAVPPAATEPAAKAEAEAVRAEQPTESVEVEEDQDSADADETSAAARPEDAGTSSSSAPAQEIPSGSLFDIQADEPAPASGSAVEPQPEELEAEPEPTDEVPKAEPAQEIPTGSLFDIAAPEPTSATQAEPELQEETEPEAQDETSEPEAAAESEPSEEPAPEARQDAAPPGATGDGAALSQAATFAASDEPEPSAEPDAQVGAPEPQSSDDEPEPEPEAKEQPKPSSSGPAHQPKTDADIDGSGSLFDL